MGLANPWLWSSRKKHDVNCQVSDSAHTGPEYPLPLEVLTWPCQGSGYFLRDSVFPQTKPTLFFYERKCYGVNLFWQLFKPSSRLDFQQPWFSYTLKWERKPKKPIRPNPNSLKQLKAYITHTHAIPMIYLVTQSPCHECSTWGSSRFSWLTLLLIVIIQIEPFCTSSTHFPTSIDANHPYRPSGGLHDSSPPWAVSAQVPRPLSEQLHFITAIAVQYGLPL